MAIKNDILSLLSDGKWHATTELQEYGVRTTINREIYNLRKEGMFIVTKKDPDVPMGWLFKLSDSKPSKAPTIYERLVDKLSDCKWHSSAELKDIAANSLLDFMCKMRKEGFVIEKEYDKYERSYCYRLKML